jgi:2-hydroxychromene-2-carboxylate isomerase
MTKSFEFLFDFGAPNSYLAHRVLPEFCAKTGSKALYVPILLGGLFKATGNVAPLIRYADTPSKRNYEQLEFQRFVDAHGLTKFRRNPVFPMNTVMLMRGAVAAQKEGILAPYVETVMAAVWEESLDMSDPDVALSVLNRSGLPGATLLRETNSLEIKDELKRNTDNAAERGAFGVPTFFVGEEMFWGKERLAQVEAALLRA